MNTQREHQVNSLARREGSQGISPRVQARQDLVRALERSGAGYDGEWAFQGVEGAQWAWTESESLKDLDLWVRNEEVAAGMAAALKERGGVAISRVSRQPRVVHQQWWLPLEGGGAVVDFTVGGLGAGPVIVVPAGKVEAQAGRLVGESAVFDLVGRPLLRGEIPSGGRLEAGMEAHRQLGATAEGLGEWPMVLAQAVRAVLAGSQNPVWAKVGRVLMVAATAAHPIASWANRHEISGRHKSAVSGLAARGVVVAFIGVDGSGKTTLLEAATEQLAAVGVDPLRIYMGMVRGNWKAVATLRRFAYKLVGGTPSELAAGAAAEAEGEKGSQEGAERQGSAERVLRWAAAWAYGIDLRLRVRRARQMARRGEVVLADRWTYDLSVEPWPGHPAGRLMSRVHPDLVVLCDGEVETMWARKPEGSLARTTERQEFYRGQVEEAGAGGVEVVRIDTTSGEDVETAAERVVRAVIRASHWAEVGEGRP